MQGICNQCHGIDRTVARVRNENTVTGDYDDEIGEWV